MHKTYNDIIKKSFELTVISLGVITRNTLRKMKDNSFTISNSLINMEILQKRDYIGFMMH
jgi:hypothetical protein